MRGRRGSSGSTLGGWAANLKARKPADAVVVLLDGQSVFVGENGNVTRKAILDRYGVDKAGLPLSPARARTSRPPETTTRCACSRSATRRHPS